jgi:hypothetical protein
VLIAQGVPSTTPPPVPGKKQSQGGDFFRGLSTRIGGQSDASTRLRRADVLPVAIDVTQKSVWGLNTKTEAEH